MRIRIDRSLLLPKSFYLLYYAGLAALQPYLSLYYRQVGLSSQEIGLLVGLPPLVSLLAGPLWAALADVSGRHRGLLIIAMLGTAFAGFAISWPTGLATLLPVVALLALFRAPAVPLVDSSVLRLLGPRKHEYGRQRLWGAVGWGLTAPLVGALAERFGLRWIFAINLPLMLACVLICLRLPAGQPQPRAALGRGLATLLRSPRWLVFLATMFCAGLGASANSDFLFLHLQDLGAPQSLMGLSLTFAATSEVLVFAVAPRLLRRQGPRCALLLALAASSLRLLGYSFLRAPWVVLPLQLLHGLAFSLLWTAGVAYADELAPVGLSATAQAAFGAVQAGLAVAVGAALNGWIYQHLGATAVFRWSSLVVALAFVFFGLVGRGKPVTPEPADEAAGLV